MQQLYLSRRNLLTLLSKLDRKKAGDKTECTLVKRDTEHKVYPSTDVIAVTAVEDADYYTDRWPGVVNSLDEPKA
jgi:hypothetical protein